MFSLYIQVIVQNPPVLTCRHLSMTDLHSSLTEVCFSEGDRRVLSSVAASFFTERLRYLIIIIIIIKDKYGDIQYFSRVNKRDNNNNNKRP